MTPEGFVRPCEDSSMRALFVLGVGAAELGVLFVLAPTRVLARTAQRVKLARGVAPGFGVWWRAADPASPRSCRNPHASLR